MEIELKEINNESYGPIFKYYKITSNRKNIEFYLEDTFIIGDIDYNPYNKEQRIIKWKLTDRDIKDINDLEQKIIDKLSKIIDLSNIKKRYGGINEYNNTLLTKIIDRKSLKINKRYYYLEELGKGEYNVCIRIDGISWDSEKGKVTYYYSTREIDALS
jgi:hypothetical protein